MPHFRKPIADKPPIPRGTFVRFSESHVALPVAPSPARHEPRVGQVWDTTPVRGGLWVVLPDGVARFVRANACTVLGAADEHVEQLAVLR